jgi:hypothetical protein
MIDHFLNWLTSTSFSQWVQSSVWGYQVILTLHSVGLGFLAGILIVIDLRILGLARRVPIHTMQPMMRVAWLGFALNAMTGCALFSADADKFFHNTVFLFKLLTIFVGMVLAVLINQSLLLPRGTLHRAGQGGVIPTRARILATVSLASWLAAIIFGRLVAFQ